MKKIIFFDVIFILFWKYNTNFGLQTQVVIVSERLDYF